SRRAKAPRTKRREGAEQLQGLGRSTEVPLRRWEASKCIEKQDHTRGRTAAPARAPGAIFEDRAGCPCPQRLHEVCRDVVVDEQLRGALGIRVIRVGAD